MPSRPYLDLTRDVMEAFGASIIRDEAEVGGSNRADCDRPLILSRAIGPPWPSRPRRWRRPGAR